MADQAAVKMRRRSAAPAGGAQFACADAGFDVAPDAGDASAGGQAERTVSCTTPTSSVDLLAGAPAVELPASRSTRL